MSSKPIDHTTTLCLACSSSLPPKSKLSEIFTTNCCNRPICPACLSANPRLARYDPCLACLGGVGAIVSGSSSKGKQVQRNVNVDGAVRDEDTFVLGDDEDESGDEEGPDYPPPPYSSPLAPGPSLSETPQDPQAIMEDDTPLVTNLETEVSNPFKYYIKPNDNLRGIALRFGVNVRSSTYPLIMS